MKHSQIPILVQMVQDAAYDVLAWSFGLEQITAPSIMPKPAKASRTTPENSQPMSTFIRALSFLEANRASPSNFILRISQI